ncbi:hypothetical protein F3Y22_tig00110858pilonHSYRG00165 [Hibiscus syriacus]|uniref:Uncharacterized protein n=1 Tax=Hibiscus syriacus TaxID=106335 RepID=A0A6A2ZL17_HIBSY|nr:hypothetical protein F3Y22_tig00110858pilonHSYRG00165 [Hibiscus syriacus]
MVWCLLQRTLVLPIGNRVGPLGTSCASAPNYLREEEVHSTISQQSRFSHSKTHLLAFNKSAFDQLQGPNHFWLNKDYGNEEFLKKGGTILVVIGRFFENSEKVGRHPNVILEKVKLFQQRFPSVEIISFQDCISVCSVNDQIAFIAVADITNVIVVITGVAILKDEACFILSKDFKNPLVFPEKDLDIAMLNKDTLPRTTSFGEGFKNPKRLARRARLPHLLHSFLSQNERTRVLSGFSLVSLAGGKPAAIGHRTPPPATAAGHRNGGRNSPKTPPKRRSKRPKTDFGVVAFIATTEALVGPVPVETSAGLLETSGEVIVALKRRQGGWNSLELWSGGWDVAM